ncbi:GGDEF domain-containing protein [Blastococcus saxobsidens]|uniref:Diguanylate cyclase (GGDEF)-like protein n=1 Tax=Blastococcus saxobsidens TaxID=138336 RepID=A0A4V2G2N7_9ACTN|nr:GGDEF domain-containing protein [Blastococcus saxobsidens]RZU33876.1 diguanylate cyclase (GGDEF)-like protein [Blastococcus saxobsidens]
MLIERLEAVLRRGDVLPAASSPASAPSGRSERGAREATPSVSALAATNDDLAAELAGTGRTAGLLLCWVGVLVMPAWTAVDHLSAPEHAHALLAVRLLVEVPMLVALVALWRWPVGRRRPEGLALLVLAVIQIAIAWMLTVVPDRQYYLLGFTLAIYGSGCIMVARPRWTGATIGLSWACLGISVLHWDDLRAADLVAVTMFVGTASVIAMLTHLRRYALHVREISTRVRLEREQQRTGVLLAQLDRLSHEDPLTGLANRRRWDAELAAMCTQARARGGALSVVLVDLDHFKDVNDRHGHAGGDAALRAVAALLSARVRGGDLVARLGGDELAVLMPGADAARAAEVAEQLRRAARTLQPDGFEPGEISLSLGVSAASGDDAYPLELMSRADEQLYRAKETRNAVGAGQRPATPAAARPVPQPAG